MGLFFEGLTDAIGFIVGALLGYGLGVTLGLNLFDAGYGTGSVIAILLVGLGGGMGLQAARRIRDRQAQPPDSE
jgi:divalent metal cation (Fe/Co/Zn/Cd) transporter